MKPLLIQVDDIRDSAQPWAAELTRAQLDEMLAADKPTEYKAAGGAKVSAKLTKMGKKVLVQATFSVPLEGVCKRCLKDVGVAEEVDLTLTFVPAETHASEKKKAPEDDGKHKKRHDDGPEGSFDAALADEEPYSGKTIDLWPAVREQVLLATPPSPLCREECKGLCPQCGQDLNERDCGHRVENIDPRWEALKAIQLQPKKSKDGKSKDATKS